MHVSDKRLPFCQLTVYHTICLLLLSSSVATRQELSQPKVESPVSNDAMREINRQQRYDTLLSPPINLYFLKDPKNMSGRNDAGKSTYQTNKASPRMNNFPYAQDNPWSKFDKRDYSKRINKTKPLVESPYLKVVENFQEKLIDPKTESSLVENSYQTHLSAVNGMDSFSRETETFLTAMKDSPSVKEEISPKVRFPLLGSKQSLMSAKIPTRPQGLKEKETIPQIITNSNQEKETRSRLRRNRKYKQRKNSDLRGKETEILKPRKFLEERIERTPPKLVKHLDIAPSASHDSPSVPDLFLYITVIAAGVFSCILFIMIGFILGKLFTGSSGSFPNRKIERVGSSIAKSFITDRTLEASTTGYKKPTDSFFDSLDLPIPKSKLRGKPEGVAHHDKDKLKVPGIDEEKAFDGSSTPETNALSSMFTSDTPSSIPSTVSSVWSHLKVQPMSSSEQINENNQFSMDPWSKKESSISLPTVDYASSAESPIGHEVKS